ncbi:MAG TPA: 6-phosphogluconolactonase, partial [Longimicrobium sp.]|nr:6-phosphogluconolactonase [Longimicrobium sp.]
MRAMIWEVGRKVPPDLRIFPDQAAMAAAAAAEVAARLAAPAANGSATLVLTGGRTARALYACLAAEHAAQVPWERLELFWGDERAVPLDDARSNYRMAREGLLEPLAIPPERVL